MRKYRTERIREGTSGSLLAVLALLLVISLPDDSLQTSASTDLGWGIPSPVKTDIADGPAGPGALNIAVDSAGDGMAVWLQGSRWHDAPTYYVFAASFSIRSGWAAPVLLDTTVAGPGGIDVAIDESGNAIAVWEHSYGDQPDDKPVVIQAMHYVKGAGWGSPSIISLGVVSAYLPQIGMDAAGNAFAVWIQYDDSMNGSIWSSTYLVNHGWESPLRIDSSDSPWVGPPVVAVDPGGNATAAWSQDADAMSGIWASRYSNGAWGTPTYIGAGWWPKIAADALGDAIVVSDLGSLSEGTSSISASRFTPDVGWSSSVLESASGYASSVFSPNVDMNAAGDAIVTWIRGSGTYMRVVASRSVSGSGWSAPVAVGSPVESRGPSHVAAIDSAGNAIVVWERIDPSPPFVLATRYSTGSGWEAEHSLDVGAGSAGSPQALFDSRGNAVIVWLQGLRCGSGIWMDTYSDSDGWGTASLVEYTPTSMSNPHVVAYGEGNAVAIWSQCDGKSSLIWTNFYREGIGWRRATPISTSSNVSFNPTIAANHLGNVVAVWEQLDGFRSSVWSGYYRYDLGWSIPIMLDDGSNNTYGPQVAIDEFGNAIAMWCQRNGSAFDIWVKRFDSSLGWESSTLISSGTTDSSTPKIEMDDMGNAMLIRANGPTIWSNRYVLGTGWTGPEEIGAQTSDIGPHVQGIFDIGNFNFALTPQGYAVAVWSMGWWNSSGGSPVGVWVNRFEPSVGWLGPKEVCDDMSDGCPVCHVGHDEVPQIVMRNQADALILWQSYFNHSHYSHILSVQCMKNSTWGVWETPTQVDLTSLSLIYEKMEKSLRVAMNPSGNAIAIWQEFRDGGIWLMASNYAVGKGWGIPVNVLENRSSVDHEFRIAMDASGNAMVIWMESDRDVSTIWSVRYDTYDIPPDASIVIPDITFLRWVAIVNSVGIIVLASLVIILYRMRSKWERSRSGSSRDDLRLEVPNSSSTQVMATQIDANGGSVPSNNLAQDRRWPTRASSGPLRLTAKERILLHLLHFARYADSLEVPPELTQERIAEAAGIERRHFTQYVNPLEEDELVRERMSRVRGAVQKRRVYVLTEEGVRRTLGVRDRIRSAMVQVRDGSGVREVTVAEALLEARGSMSVLDVLRESIETGVVDLTRSASFRREPASVTVLDSSNVEEIDLMR